MATLKMVQGGTMNVIFRWRIGGVPQPLGGWHPECQMRHPKTNELVLDFAQYMTVEPEGATGVIQLSVPGSITLNIKTDGVWDLFLEHDTDPNQRPYLGGGKIDLKRTVSR